MGLGWEVAGSGHGVALAQQRNQTDLQFARERASLVAAERRVEAMRNRLNALGERSADPPERARSERSEARVSERLRHRGRAVPVEDIDALHLRLQSAQETARSLGERINRPDFGAGLRTLEQQLAELESEISRLE